MKTTSSFSRSVAILITGGTFDKSYDPVSGNLIFTQSHIPTLLKAGRAEKACSFRQLFLVDSLDMTKEQRNELLKACKQSAEDALVVVHGTDTLLKSARALQELGLSKTIVFTGAFIPAELEHSDAAHNLAFALGVAKCQSHGVYLAINGQIFDPAYCKKDESKEFFCATL